MMTASRLSLAVAALVLTILVAPASAQRDSSVGPHPLFRWQVGFLNQDDPLDFEFGYGVDAGVDFGNRVGIVLRLVGQGRVRDPGRAGPVPDYRIVLAGGLEYAPARRGGFGEQVRVRLSGGVMIRDAVASAAVIAPGFVFRYPIRGTPFFFTLAMEDILTFLPTEQVGALTLDAKIEHNFLALLGLEFRP
jgi:hypothetical protein